MKIKFRAVFGWLVLVALCVLAIEAACQLAYRVHKGKWYWVERKSSPRGMVQIHPYFGASLTPSISVERNGVRITHNSFRCRGPEFSRPKPAGRIRLVTLGGSSTYCVGVSDDETWPHFLGQHLNSNHEIINMASPGGTSVETMIQSTLLFSDVQPDVAIYYLGWNDARVQHIKDLWPDWSDSHGKWVTSFALSSRELSEPTAMGYLFKRMAFQYFFPRMDHDKALREIQGTPDALTDKIDLRALGHYERNLHNIVAVCRKQRVEPVFLPQVLNYRALTSDKPYGFLPFVRDRDLKKVMEAYNESMARVAREENVIFGQEILEQAYGDAHFIDNGHFSREGNRLFAGALAKCLQRAGFIEQPARR